MNLTLHGTILHKKSKLQLSCLDIFISLQKSESGPRQIKVTGKYSDGTPFEDTFNTVVFAIGRDADTSRSGY